MEERRFDLVVIGAGPGGYVAAIRAAQLGLGVAVVERGSVGGVCLNVGCIPSKALIHEAGLFLEGRRALEDAGVKLDFSGFDYAAVWRKSRTAADRLSRGVAYLLKKNGVELVRGTARLSGPRRVAVEGPDSGELVAGAVVLATGSRPRVLPGFPFDERLVLSSTGLLMQERLPRRLAILGAGAIGMETAYAMGAFGVEVTVVELLDRVLPLEDAEASAVVAKAFTSRGARILVGTRAVGWRSAGEGEGEGIVLSLEGKDGSRSELEADQALVSAGRSPNIEGLGLEELGVRLSRGFVETDDWMETSAAGIYAIGDIVASPLLAHVASKEGEIAASHAAAVLQGRPPPAERRLDPLLVPSAVYCEPEVGSFGLSEASAREGGVPHAVARFPYRGIGKAVAVGAAEGQVKLVHDPGSGEILGASVVGAGATEVVHELLLAKRAELLLGDVADMVHAHPTISEGLMEAARAGLGRAVHA